VRYGLTHKAVKNELKSFPYKISAVQQLKDADYQKRLNYCEWLTDFITENGEDILAVTFYTDEV
jgi:hypothetical protein